MATSKAIATMREIKTSLQLRLGALWTITEALSAGGDPTLAISLTSDGAWTAAEEYALLTLSPVADLGTDILGLAQRVVCPHVMKIGLEESAVADVSVLTTPRFTTIVGECIARGFRTEIYHSANTVQPVAATLVAANLQTAFAPDIYNPLTNQM